MFLIQFRTSHLTNLGLIWNWRHQIMLNVKIIVWFSQHFPSPFITITWWWCACIIYNKYVCIYIPKISRKHTPHLPTTKHDTQSHSKAFKAKLKAVAPMATAAITPCLSLNPPRRFASLSSSTSVFFSYNVCSRPRLGLSLNRPKNRGLSCNCLFGLGVPELVVIAGVAALLFGPKKLPEVGRSIGKTVKSFQQVFIPLRFGFLVAIVACYAYNL